MGLKFQPALQSSADAKDHIISKGLFGVLEFSKKGAKEFVVP